MKGNSVMAVLACLLLAACPDDATRQAAQQQTSGKYTEYCAQLRRQANFEAELKRLQEHFGGEASPASVSSGSAQLRYKLGQRVREDAIAIVIRDNSSGEEQVLWIWQDNSGQQAAPIPTNQQESSGGMSLEYQLDEDIYMSVSLRWVQDRYLEVKRTYEAGGLDMEAQLGSGYTQWLLEGASLPYRLAAGLNGPFGVVPAGSADGNWHGSRFPGELMLPGLAAYDQSRGVLLAISDDHPREMDRRYDCAWRIDQGTGNDESKGQLRIDYSIYNTTIDGYSEPILFSGLPVRDSVVIEPFSLQPTTMEDSFVAGTTEQVADRMSDFVRAFHARYQPAEIEAEHTMLELGRLAADQAALDEILRFKTGLWDTTGLISDMRDGNSLPDGLSSRALDGELLSLSEEYGISEWRMLSPFVLPADSSVLAADSELLMSEATAGELAALSLRRPQTADMILTAMDEAGADTAFVLDLATGADGGQDPARMQLVASQDAAAHLLAMKICEDNAARGDGRQLAILGLPSIALPPCAERYLLPAGDGSSLFGQRMLGMLATRIFGVRAWPGSGIDSTAGLVLAGSQYSGGLLVSEAAQAMPGSGKLLENVDKLFEEAGTAADYSVLHCEPRYGSYTLTGEAPALPDSALIGLPAKWTGRSAMFVCCFGSGIDAQLDKEMQMLNILLDDQGSVLQEMPFGLYEIVNPDAAAVPAGDVLVLERQLISPGSDGRG